LARHHLGDVIVLLIVGVVLVVFGGLVLLRFPDRPGGRISWQGVEVSSVGAGLPLVVVGVVAVAFAASRSSSLGFGTSTPPGVPIAAAALTNGCLGGVFRGIPADRLASVEEGASDQVVIRATQSLSGLAGVRLTELGKTVGGMTFNYVPASSLFKIGALVDRSCKPVAGIEDVDRPGQDPTAPQNWDTLRVPLDGGSYDLRLGSAPAIELSFARVAT
jgi:hypothetical protein